jgi:hypothetical protein
MDFAEERQAVLEVHQTYGHVLQLVVEVSQLDQPLSAFLVVSRTSVTVSRMTYFDASFETNLVISP